MRKKRCEWVFLCLVVGLFLVPAMQAQNVGAVSGRVTDTTDAVIPGATVEFRNLDTGVSRTVTSDAQGNYRAPELPLGNYQIEASFAGFQKVQRTGVQLTLGRDATVNFQLPVGEVQEVVTVTGDAPLVETTKADMGSLVTREQISELPLRNRDFSQLITLQAGTTQFRHSGESSGAAGSRGARISVSGARPTANSFTLDGADVNNPYGLIPSGVDGTMLGVEAIREFKVLSSNYSAQHGRASGANLVAVSRSGTNEFHGSLFEYLRNDNLDANAWGSNARNTRRQELRRNQFGGSVGGPVRHDKLFFFTTYEAVRDRLPRTRTADVPTPEARNGILREVQADGSCRVNDVSARVASAVRPYLALWPQPTGAIPACGITAEFVRSDARPTDNDYISVRMDYNFHSNHSLFGRYTLDDSVRTDEDTIPLFGQDTVMRNQYVTLEQSSILSPTMINKARVAYSRTAQAENVLEIAPPGASLSFVTGRPFGGITTGSGVTALSGYSASIPRLYYLNTFQVYDDVTWERSNHSIKLGGVVERFVFHRTGQSRLGGAWTFRNFSDFLTNAAPRRLRIQGPDEFACPSHGTCYADPHRSLTQTLVASYFQDDWRMRPNLTLNLGVRHEYTSVPSEKFGRLANIRDLFAPTTTVGDPLYPQTTLDNFSPRVGFAWDPWSSGSTSVRGGVALFYEPLLYRNILVTIDRQPPFWADIDPPVAQLGGLFPNLDPHLARLALGPQAVHALDRDVKTPYTMQSSLAVQRMLGASNVIELGYTFTRGVHLASRADMAIPLLLKQPDGRWYFCSSGPPCPVTGTTVGSANDPLLNPSFTRLEWYSFGAYSNYHGLRATWTRNLSQGLHFQAAYTWSKAMDVLSTQFSGELGDSSVQNAFDIPSDYGLADFHVNHNFVSNFTYDLPFGPNRTLGSGASGVAGAMVGGWQVSGVFSAQTGLPISVDGDPATTHTLNRGGARPDLKAGGNPNPVYENRNTVIAGQPGFLWFDPSHFISQQPGYYGNAGRNTIIGPGVVKMDFSVLKNTRLSEGTNIQFRAEFFNLFNSPEFSPPSSTALFSGATRNQNAGLVSETRLNSARQIQLALRFTF